MYPVLFHVFGVPITGYGAMMIVGFLVGNWITRVRWRELHRDPEVPTTLLGWVIVGGIVGAKLYFAVDTWARGERSFADALLAHDGITWYGGAIGAVAAAAVGCRIQGVSFRLYADTACVGAMVGEALGRVGCFLVGDDYGGPTDLPWGMTFPHGDPPTLTPVHPAQLYEIALLLPAAALLWRRRHTSPSLFAEYFALNGLGRIIVEHWRVNPRVAFGLTEPQWIGLCLIALGTSGAWLARRHPSPARA
jgi:phosphatidylglycerol:prolipoprotein diacylglycerol transferase